MSYCAKSEILFFVRKKRYAYLWYFAATLKEMVSSDYIEWLHSIQRLWSFCWAKSHISNIYAAWTLRIWSSDKKTVLHEFNIQGIQDSLQYFFLSESHRLLNQLLVVLFELSSVKKWHVIAAVRKRRSWNPFCISKVIQGVSKTCFSFMFWCNRF